MRQMMMTSVSGHLLSYEFTNMYKSWKNVDPSMLFDAPIEKVCPEDYGPIKVSFNIIVSNSSEYATC